MSEPGELADDAFAMALLRGRSAGRETDLLVRRVGVRERASSEEVRECRSISSQKVLAGVGALNVRILLLRRSSGPPLGVEVGATTIVPSVCALMRECAWAVSLRSVGSSSEESDESCSGKKDEVEEGFGQHQGGRKWGLGMFRWHVQ